MCVFFLSTHSSLCLLFSVSLTVDEETAAIDAFQLMVTKDVDGLAICNKEGRLRGNISLRDRQ